MAMIPRGMQVPARWRLLACGLFLMASCSIAAGADEGIVDVHALPQLEGAVEDISRPDPYSVEYRVPMRQARDAARGPKAPARQRMGALCDAA
ncbi:hypothetical protein ACVIQY_003404 [Bradyrhizobium sp. USDA 3051]